jgi:hypothetical protein
MSKSEEKLLLIEFDKDQSHPWHSLIIYKTNLYIDADYVIISDTSSNLPIKNYIDINRSRFSFKSNSSGYYWVSLKNVSAMYSTVKFDFGKNITYDNMPKLYIVSSETYKDIWDVNAEEHPDYDLLSDATLMGDME